MWKNRPVRTVFDQVAPHYALHFCLHESASMPGNVRLQSSMHFCCTLVMANASNEMPTEAANIRQIKTFFILNLLFSCYGLKLSHIRSGVSTGMKVVLEPSRDGSAIIRIRVEA
jgi:hypothetical protein